MGWGVDLQWIPSFLGFMLGGRGSWMKKVTLWLAACDLCGDPFNEPTSCQTVTLNHLCQQLAWKSCAICPYHHLFPCYGLISLVKGRWSSAPDIDFQQITHLGTAVEKKHSVTLSEFLPFLSWAWRTSQWGVKEDPGMVSCWWSALE